MENHGKRKREEKDEATHEREMRKRQRKKRHEEKDGKMHVRQEEV